MTERHKFIPDVVWVHGDGGWLVPLNRADDPKKWMEICSSDQPIVTQVDDGTPEEGDRGFFPTSSSSAPSIMAAMLDALDVRPGMKVLEIGTGTGYNAALLADIVGTDNVTTIELDRQIAEHARKVLQKNSYQIVPIVGDGIRGYPENAPYDRLIATAAAREIPYAWIRQVSPGGRIVVPVTFMFRDTGAMLTLTVHDDGTATGRFGEDLSFMILRSQRPQEWSDTAGNFEITNTTNYPGEPFESNYEARFAIGAILPGCREGRTFEFEEQDGSPAICIQHQDSGSWASVTPEKGIVRQHGPRKLWNELVSAYQWWTSSGKPGHERFGMTVSRTGQQIWLDTPQNPI